MTSFAVRPSCDHPGKDGIGSRGEAEQAKDTHLEFCNECSEDDVVIDDGIDDMQDEVEVVRHGDGGQEVVADGEGEPGEVVTDQLPEKPAVDEDPLVWMPDEFTDTIDGSVAINRKGYEVMAHHYGIETRSDPVVTPDQTDCTFAQAKAVAITDDGKRYEAQGSAHVDRGDDPWLLVSMADTRARKRALAQATGVGMVAIEELKGGTA